MTTRSRYKSVRQSVLENDNLLGLILSKVDTSSDGWSFRQWAAVSAVCKQWRHQMLRQPVQLHLVDGANTAEQAQCLLDCPAPVRVLSYCHHSASSAALALLRDPGFQQRSGQHLHRLDLHRWLLQRAMQLVVQPQPPYPQLQELVLETAHAAWQQEGRFNAACLSAFTSLTSLTLLNPKVTPDLLRAPASLKHVTLSLYDLHTGSKYPPLGNGLRLPDGVRLHSLHISSASCWGSRQCLLVDAAALLLAEEVAVLVGDDDAHMAVSIMSHWSCMDFWAQLAASPVQRLTIQAANAFYGGVTSDDAQTIKGWSTVLASMGLELTTHRLLGKDAAVRTVVQQVGLQRPHLPLFGAKRWWHPREQQMPTLVTTEVPIAKLDLSSFSSRRAQELLTHPTFLTRMDSHVTALRGVQLDGDWLSLAADSYPRLERLQVKLLPDSAAWPHGAWVPPGIKRVELSVSFAAHHRRRQVPNISREVAALLKRTAARKDARQAQALMQMLAGLPFTVASITE